MPREQESTMRILIASHYLPWPLNSGGNAAQFSTLKCLAEDHQFTLVCPVYTEAEFLHVNELQRQLPQVYIRPVCYNKATRTRFLARIVRFIRGGRLLDLSAHQHPEPPGMGRPYYPFLPLPENLILVLQEELSKGTDLFQAEFVEMLPLGAWIPENIPKLFIHYQIHFVYSDRFLTTRGRDGYSDYLNAAMRVQEVAYLQNFEGVITLSEEDRQCLVPYVAPEKLFVSPFPIPADIGIATDLPQRFDGRFLLVASEGHAPNRDALAWLLADVWPKIKSKLPLARLLVVGEWSESAKIRHSTAGLSFLGFIPELATTLRGGILLVPLRIGSGIRVKIMVALAQGVPVISTTVGCEGLQVKDGQEILVRDDPQEFSKAAIQLAQDPELWRRLAVKGRTAATDYYSPEVVRRRRNEIYAELAENHRRARAP